MGNFGVNSTTVDGGFELGTDDIGLLRLMTPADMGTVTQMDVYMRGPSSGSVNCKPVIFNAGASRTLVTVLGEKSISGTAYGWQQWTGLSVALSASTEYDFGLWSAGSSIRIAYQSTPTTYDSYYDSDGGSYAGGTPNSPFVATSTYEDDGPISIYLTYTPAASGLLLPIVHHYRVNQ